MNNLRASFLIGLARTAMIVAIIALPYFALADATTTATAQTPTTSGNPNVSVAAAVQSYFADIPVMIGVAKCESGPRQFAANGSPLFAGAGNDMVGIFQIDYSIHYARALSLGFDITTVAGNMGYARYLYGAEGTDPWISSFSCWGISNGGNNGGTSTSATGTLTLTLSLGSIDPQVLLLQQLLNQNGFVLASSGPGSPGNETSKFGALTYAALRNFQCVKGIACSGDESTTGYGLLNGATRTALLAMATPANGSSTPTSTPPIITTSTPPTGGTADNSAEINDLKNRIAALVTIVNQLEAEIAARI